MKTLVIASHNQHKITEIQAILSEFPVEIKSVDEIGAVPEVKEDGTTFQENAIKKARETAAATQMIVLADDSGLEVDFLAGAPGVYSARYAGEHGNDHLNNEKLLRELRNVPWEKRTARFQCVIALADPAGNVETCFGTCEGYIGYESQGESGFGYDPLFFVPEFEQTFAELPMEIKNRISHRGRALVQLQALISTKFLQK